MASLNSADPYEETIGLTIGTYLSRRQKGPLYHHKLTQSKSFKQ